MNIFLLSWMEGSGPGEGSGAQVVLSKTVRAQGGEVAAGAAQAGRRVRTVIPGWALGILS